MIAIAGSDELSGRLSNLTDLNENFFTLLGEWFPDFEIPGGEAVAVATAVLEKYYAQWMTLQESGDKNRPGS